MTIATSRPDADQSLIPRRGSLDVLKLVKYGGLFRYDTRHDLTRAGRVHDAWVWSGGFLVGVLCMGAVAVVAVSLKVVAQ